MATDWITGKEFLNHKRPIVYTWRRGEEWLYVGIGKCGLGRIFAGHPHIRVDTVQDDDIIAWTFFETKEAASQEECRLIREHQPKYNVAHTWAWRKTMQKTHRRM